MYKMLFLLLSFVSLQAMQNSNKYEKWECDDFSVMIDPGSCFIKELALENNVKRVVFSRKVGRYPFSMLSVDIGNDTALCGDIGKDNDALEVYVGKGHDTKKIYIDGVRATQFRGFDGFVIKCVYKKKAYVFHYLRGTDGGEAIDFFYKILGSFKFID